MAGGSDLGGAEGGREDGLGGAEGGKEDGLGGAEGGREGGLEGVVRVGWGEGKMKTEETGEEREAGSELEWEDEEPEAGNNGRKTENDIQKRDTSSI